MFKLSAAHGWKLRKRQLHWGVNQQAQHSGAPTRSAIARSAMEFSAAPPLKLWLVSGRKGLANPVGFAWCNQSVAAVNSTSTVREDKDLCNQVWQMNCTDATPTAPESTHFSECPPSFEGYCIQGQCRFLTSEQQPSCICKLSYTGSRCEMVDLLYITGERGKYIIIGLVLAMVVLIVLVIIICLCVHRYCRRCNGRRKWRPGVNAVKAQTVEEGYALGQDDDAAMTTLA